VFQKNGDRFATLAMTEEKRTDIAREGRNVAPGNPKACHCEERPKGETRQSRFKKVLVFWWRVWDIKRESAVYPSRSL
jgi:hypothetical protein